MGEEERGGDEKPVKLEKPLKADILLLSWLMFRMVDIDVECSIGSMLIFLMLSCV